MSVASLRAGEGSVALRLGVLFAGVYFIQGIAEPGEGLIAQPVRSLLKSWGHSAAEIAAFSALLGLPWVLKPLYGLLTDFVPLAGSRRRSYLLATSAAATIALGYLYLRPPGPGSFHWLLAALLVPTVAIAFADVVADALMVEKGQPRGITGKLQSVQWASVYAATILTGALGGYLSQRGEQSLGFLICALATAGTFAFALAFVRDEEPPLPGGARAGLRALRETARNRAIWAACAFLFLWNFNPFTSAVLYVHMTREMGLSEQFYGNTISVLAAASVGACIAYALYCRRVAFRSLVHLAIVMGILCTLAYWGMTGPVSAMAVTVAVGATYMTGTLIQLDLAARTCLASTAGTTFATLMAVSNLGYSLATGLGGHLYDAWSAHVGSDLAFDLLVGAGAASTALCWLIVPFLTWAEPVSPLDNAGRAPDVS